MRVAAALLIACATVVGGTTATAQHDADATIAEVTPEEVIGPWLLPEPEDNAFDDYVRAFEAMQDTERVAELLDEGRGRQEPATDVFEANVEAFVALAEALPKTCLVPTVERFEDAAPYLAQSRSMSRLLALKGIAHEMQGEFGAAFASYCDGIKMGHDMARGAPIIHRLMSYAITAIECRQIRLTVLGGQAPEEDLRVLLERLTELGSSELPLAHTYAYELQSSASIVRTQGDDLPLMGRAYLGAALPELTDAYARFIRLADEPYRETIGLLPHSDDYASPVAASVLPVVDKTQQRAARAKTIMGATRLVVAIELYRQANGDVPERLDALVPDYLPELPGDQFSLGGFQYAAGPAADDYVLYSIGEDMRDDGGSVEDDRVYGPLHDLQ